MEELCFYLLAAVFLLLHTTTAAGSSSITNVTLLALVPWPDERAHADWDAGPDLLTSARVAINEVNSNPNILPDHRLLLEERGHEACGLEGGNFGILNLAKYAINPRTSSTNVLAVIGLFCSGSTKDISPVAGSKNVNLVQLAVANSPDFLKYQSSYPHLWRFLESATVHADAMVSIMDQFGWKKAALIVDLENSFFSGIGERFRQTLLRRDDLELVYQGGLLRLSNIENVIEGIRNYKARIIFLSTTAPQAALIYCLAVRYSMFWPNYVWVLADYLSSVILYEVDQNKYCSVNELRKIMDKSLITYFHLEPEDPSILLVSNNTYSGYKTKYYEELENVRKEYEDIAEDIPGDYLYGGLIYDQVWAFALALNAALPEMALKNLSVTSYTTNRLEVTRILEEKLMLLDFVGATGKINFTVNREVISLITIYQVNNFTDVTVGIYDARNTSNMIVNIGDPPSDEINTIYTLLPLALTIIMAISCLASIIFVTANMAFIIVLRKKSHEILALSPNLSILIFIGCYFECVATILITFRSSTSQLPEVAFTVLCNIEMWLGMLGIYIILATSLFKIARIFRIFTYFGKTGKRWNDTSLAFYVLVVCSIPCLLLLAWMSVDHLKYTPEELYHTEMIPVYVEILTRCDCNFYAFWFGFLYSYMGVLICGLIFFAIQTRKIDRYTFIDTKKVIGFVFLMTIMFGVLITTEQILILTKNYIWANIALSFIFLSICVISQLFLIAPKVYPALYTKFGKARATQKSTNSFEKRSSDTREPHTFTNSFRKVSRSSLVKQVSLTKMWCK